MQFATVQKACRAALLALGGLLSGAATGYAAEYPTRPVRFIVPFVPGGSNDLIARMLSEHFRDEFSESFVVDNRPGANTIIGTSLAAKAPSDGHTIIIVSGSLATNVSVVGGKLPYDTMNDLAPVGLIAKTPYVLIANPNSGFKNLSELLKLAERKPGDIVFASAGIGNITHLAGELLNMTAGVKLRHVPYKGAGQLMPDLVGGRVALYFSTPVTGLPYVKSGKLLGLGVTTGARCAALPDVPTFEELGLRGYEVSGWFGLIAPAGTPTSTVNRLNAALVRTLAKTNVKERLVGLGVDPTPESPASFRALIVAEIEKWRRVVEKLGLNESDSGVAGAIRRVP